MIVGYLLIFCGQSPVELYNIRVGRPILITGSVTADNDIPRYTGSTSGSVGDASEKLGDSRDVYIFKALFQLGALVPRNHTRPCTRSLVTKLEKKIERISLQNRLGVKRGVGRCHATLELREKVCSEKNGGEGGIRTPDTLSGMPVFKTGAINHSATSPANTVLLQSQFYGREAGEIESGCLH